MIVKAYYSSGRIDVFDTDRMTDGVPQPGNLLTNYTIDLSDVNGESLWPCPYYYEAAQAYRDEKGPKGLPVARRRDSWSFLIADAEDMQRLNRVTLDGETVLAQMAGELVDVSALSSGINTSGRNAMTSSCHRAARSLRVWPLMPRLWNRSPAPAYSFMKYPAVISMYPWPKIWL